jgi:hypothetical protein
MSPHSRSAQAHQSTARNTAVVSTKGKRPQQPALTQELSSSDGSDSEPEQSKRKRLPKNVVVEAQSDTGVHSGRRQAPKRLVADGEDDTEDEDETEGAVEERLNVEKPSDEDDDLLNDEMELVDAEDPDGNEEDNVCALL